MTNILELDNQLNQAILTGKALEAFEIFYADDVVMQENDQPATIGKDANRQREQAFFGAITNFRGAEVIASAAGENTTFSLWHNDFDHRDYGTRNYHQTAVRTWKGGKVVREVFYYG